MAHKGRGTTEGNWVTQGVGEKRQMRVSIWKWLPPIGRDSVGKTPPYTTSHLASREASQISRPEMTRAYQKEQCYGS